LCKAAALLVAAEVCSANKLAAALALGHSGGDQLYSIYPQPLNQEVDSVEIPV
jgi:hypothetical protein